MSRSIGDPYLLSSYGLPKTPKRSASTSDMRPRVYATHGQTSSSHDGYVTVTAQADGVHILDVRFSQFCSKYVGKYSTALYTPPNNIPHSRTVDDFFMSCRIPLYK